VAELNVIAIPGGTTPHGYTLGQSEGLAPQTVEATFDGSAAAGDFLPTLTILTPDLRVLSRTFPSETVTAGDTAAVTFAPF
jgi:hypothetical protein